MQEPTERGALELFRLRLEHEPLKCAAHLMVSTT